MAKVIWRAEALDELERIITYIEQFDPVAADKTSIRLYGLGQSLEDFPRRGRPVEDGTREMTGVPPYVLSYRIDGDRVFVLSIRHGRRQR